MKILGIETSCDETAVAIVDDQLRVLDEAVLSQIDRHQVFGGVIPEIAAREHLKVLDQMVASMFERTGLTMAEIDAIAVTQGPGLVGALLVGASYAKGLHINSAKPLIPVNHVHAHIHGAMLAHKDCELPCLALVVSGGHTHIYFVKTLTELKLLFYTADDACGECFDKVAKLFGLGYPGGPVVEKMAAKGQDQQVAMPPVGQDKPNSPLSYSGLKTYMVNLYAREAKPIFEDRLADIMASFQKEALAQLCRKTKVALRQHPNARSVLVAGGVSANQVFREMMRKEIPIPTHFPSLKHCSDNGAMIAAMGHAVWQSEDSKERFQSVQWDCYSRYPY